MAGFWEYHHVRIRYTLPQVFAMRRGHNNVLLAVNYEDWAVYAR